MIKQSWFILFPATLFMLLTQCGSRHSYPPELAVLDSLAGCQADSATILLDSLAPLMENAPEATRRYFQLLNIKVRDKANLPLTDDSLVSQLVGYYENDGDRHLLPLAYYYAGRTFISMNDAPQALDFFLKANELLSDEHYQLKAVTNSQAGYIFSHQKLYRPAIEAFKIAYRCDSMAGDTVGMVFNLKDLGINYENVNRRDTSILYFEKAMQIAEASGNERMVLIMKTQLAGLYSRTGKYGDAEVFIRDAIKYKNPDNLAAVYSIAAGLFEKTNRIDSAEHYYQLLAQTNSVYAKERGYRGLADIAIIQHDLTSAHKYIVLYKTFSDSLVKITATNAVAEMNAQYNYQLREKENVRLREANERKRHVIQLIGLSSAMVVLLLLVALLYINYKNLTIKIRLERRKRVKAVVELAAQQKAELSLSTTPKPEEVAILKDIKKILNDHTDVNKYLSANKWDSLAAYIETAHPLFKEHIAEVTKLKEFKYHVCLLVKAGFSISDIAQLTQHSKEAVTSARRRMAEDAFGKSSKPHEWDDFLHSL